MVIDPTLTIALVITIGWALSYRAKWRRAERQANHHRLMSEARLRVINNQALTVAELLEKLEATEKEVDRKEQLRKDAFAMYREQLSENAFLRSGGAAE